ncbi:AsnC family transcriptional regulator [Actinomadura rubrobrunea]|uniref:AsnC family transcriptional regulator n=1 Tax=Actinomadura rubrobrunea TaxID=115335 RepID=A0A9W6PWD2_9ACTN|nr:Lrp/AsnC family transcriptional regulator [Actinomadura rubrobrunea]GLW65145.1 AsnC family transcriptional regulator [Actinomadura rubrobrunea]
MLDAVDAVLVRELQRDGRATFQALADRVGLSRTAVRARVQHLLESQVVRVVGIVHAAVVGAEAIGHVSVTVDGSAREVAAVIAARPAVSFAALTAGPHDVVAQIRTRDDAALAAEVDYIRSVPGVRAAEVFRSVTTVRDTHSVVRELGEISLDDIDWRLLQELQRDGRAPYTRLANIIGLSQAATRARVVRLMRSGVIQVTGLADPHALGARELGGFGLVVTGGLRRVAEAVAEQDGVRYVATGFGRYDIVGQAEAASRAELVSVLDAIRAVPGATVRESWHHLDVVKESYAVELPDKPLNGAVRSGGH